MSGERRLYLDACPGERRGVVLLDGRPERLLIAREGEPPAPALGAVYAGRVGEAGPGGGRWIDLGEGPSGWLPRAPPGLAQGAAVEIEVVAESRGGKGPRLAFRGTHPGPAPRRLAEAPDLLARLQGFAPGDAVAGGPAAREAADLAQAQALAVEHALPGGLRLTVEPTRALVAVDVDAAALGAARVQDANLRAIRHAARLVRLKALGGAVVIDLVGAAPAAGLMRAEAARAFAPDGPQVRVLAPDALGLLAVSRPWAERPLAQRLLGLDGAPTARTRAQALVRDLQRELAARPGALLEARCDPAVAAALAPLAASLGPRVRVAAELGRPPGDPDIAER